jgi:hypothetical protein
MELIPMEDDVTATSRNLPDELRTACLTALDGLALDPLWARYGLSAAILRELAALCNSGASSPERSMHSPAVERPGPGGFPANRKQPARHRSLWRACLVVVLAAGGGLGVWCAQDAFAVGVGRQPVLSSGPDAPQLLHVDLAVHTDHEGEHVASLKPGRECVAPIQTARLAADVPAQCRRGKTNPLAAILKGREQLPNQCRIFTLHESARSIPDTSAASHPAACGLTSRTRITGGHL